MSASCPKHLLSDGVEALLCTHVHTHIVKTPAGTRFGSIAIHAHTHMCKPPAGARFGSIAIHAHAHPFAQHTCRHTVWRHCYTHTCPPMCSKHLQAHCLEALLYTRVPINFINAPAGTRSGGIATHGRAQNACRQTCLKQCDTHAHAHRHIQNACRLVVWKHCDTDR